MENTAVMSSTELRTHNPFILDQFDSWEHKENYGRAIRSTTHYIIPQEVLTDKLQDYQISGIIQLNHPNIVLAKGTFAPPGELELRTQYFLKTKKVWLIPELDSFSRREIVRSSSDISIRDVLSKINRKIVDSNFKCDCKIDL